MFKVEKVIKRKSDKLYVKRFYHATIADWKNATDDLISKFVKKFDLASLKSETDKLEATPVDLKKLNDVVKKVKRLLKRFV